MATSELDRRAFLKGMGMASATALAAVSVAHADEGQGGPEGQGGQGGQGGPQGESEPLPPANGPVGGALCSEDWLGEMPTVEAGDIVATYDFDVVVLGAGHAGAQAILAAAQQGASVAGVEAQAEEDFSSFGDDIAAYNSQLAIDNGFGPYETGEIVDEYIRRGAGRVNTALIRSYVEQSGEMFDNLVATFGADTDMFDDGQYAIQCAYGKHEASDYPVTSGGYKSWATTFQSGGTTNPEGVFGREGVTRMTEVDLRSIKAAEDLGAEMFWGTSAYSLVMDGDAVTGAIVEGPDGFVQLNAAKGVILCLGDYSGNADMVYNLLDEVAEWGARNGMDRNGMRGFGRDGMGVKLGCWAGGAIEPRPRPTMDGKVPGAWHTTPMLFLDSTGERFMNEAQPQLYEPVMRRTPQGNIAIITDAKYMESIKQCGVDHGAPNWGYEPQIERMQAYMEAIVPGPEGGNIPSTDVINLVADMSDRGELGEFEGNWVVAANTVDELLDYLGYEGDAKEAALASIERYNELCAAGLDSDFGKDAKFMLAIDEAPFYACVEDNKKTPKAGLVCLNGLSTNGVMNVLKVDHNEPIPGLYAAGNTLGERYGNGYVGTSAGNSIGMAMTHGRVCGKYVASL